MLRLLLFLALALPLPAQETMLRQVFDPGTDTHVEIVALFTKPSPGGFMPVRVKIANNLKDDRSIRLDFDGATGYNDNLHTRTRFDLTAAAGKTVTRDLMVPLSPPGGFGENSMLNLHLSGSLGEGYDNIQSSFHPLQPAVLLSDSLFTPYGSALDSEMTAKLGRSSRGSNEFAAKFDPKQLPDDWLAFSGYDSVVMTDTDWTAVPPGGRNAILSWLRLGGQLLVCAGRGTTLSELGLPGEAGFGQVAIVRFDPASFDPKTLIGLVMTHPNGPQQASLQDDYRNSWPLQNRFGGKTFNYSLFVGVLVLFAVLVGPVNFFVFAKSGQRHRLFVTTPLISLGTSLVLVGLIVAQDGFGGSGTRLVLMEVRPDNEIHAAFVHQEQFSRTGVLTNTDFTLPSPSLMSPVALAESRWARFTAGQGSKGDFNMQPDDGKLHAAGDWFQSRSEQGHLLSAVISTRGRIEQTPSPDTLLSTFDYPIDTLFFLDDHGQWHRADGIQPGKRFTLATVNASIADAELKELIHAFGRRNARLMENASTRPGHFVALTTRAPGIDTLPGIRWKETRTVITGPVVAP